MYLGRLVMFPSLGEVSLHPVGPSSMLLSVHRIVCSWGAPCVGYVGPFVVAGLTSAGVVVGGVGLWCT